MVATRSLSCFGSSAAPPIVDSDAGVVVGMEAGVEVTVAVGAGVSWLHAMLPVIISIIAKMTEIFVARAILFFTVKNYLSREA